MGWDRVLTQKVLPRQAKPRANAPERCPHCREVTAGPPCVRGASNLEDDFVIHVHGTHELTTSTTPPGGGARSVEALRPTMATANLPGSSHRSVPLVRRMCRPEKDPAARGRTTTILPCLLPQGTQRSDETPAFLPPRPPTAGLAPCCRRGRTPLFATAAPRPSSSSCHHRSPLGPARLASLPPQQLQLRPPPRRFLAPAQQLPPPRQRQEKKAPHQLPPPPRAEARPRPPPPPAPPPAPRTGARRSRRRQHQRLRLHRRKSPAQEGAAAAGQPPRKPFPRAPAAREWRPGSGAPGAAHEEQPPAAERGQEQAQAPGQLRPRAARAAPPPRGACAPGERRRAASLQEPPPGAAAAAAAPETKPSLTQARP